MSQSSSHNQDVEYLTRGGFGKNTRIQLESCPFVNKFSPNLNWSGNIDINKVELLTDYITIPLDIDQIVTKNVFVTRNGTWCE